MKRAILMSVTGLAAAFAVLAAGYLATDPQRAIADEAPKAAASAGALAGEAGCCLAGWTTASPRRATPNPRKPSKLRSRP